MDYTDCNDFLWPIEIFGLKITFHSGMIISDKRISLQTHR
jgi:hypothetical protein